ncbi:MAG: NTP transferase domain-containing protein [Sphaerochaeta sp.]|nr:NTP transferase domain-containing protein [Sphaerochaeta sp.]
MSTLEQLFIDENATIRKTLEQLDQTAKRILLIAPEGKLKAVVTDGDIRRHLIRNGRLDAAVSEVATYNPKSVTRETRASAREIMRQYSITALPMIDEQGIVESLLFANDFELTKKSDLAIPVVINAGGVGSRLYPYTKILPKPLIPIGDQPILELIMIRFQRFGCNDFHVIVNHKKNLIKAFFADSPKEYNLHFVDEDIPLGTGGGLSLLKGTLHDTFFFSNCDILIDADYASMYRQHKRDKNIITMVCALKNVVIPYGVINMSENGTIDSFIEKPEYSFLTNTGLYLVEPEVIEDLQMNESISFPEIMDKYRKQGKNVGVYPVSEKAWMDMGQLEELELMKKRLETNE